MVDMESIHINQTLVIGQEMDSLAFTSLIDESHEVLEAIYKTIIGHGDENAKSNME